MKPIATLAASCPPLLPRPLLAPDAEHVADPVAAGLGGKLKDGRLPVDHDAHVVAVDRRLCPRDGELLDSGRERGGADRGYVEEPACRLAVAGLERLEIGGNDAGGAR